MEWLIILIIGYFVYLVARQLNPNYQKNQKEKLIEKLETQASKMLEKLITNDKEDIERFKNNKNWGAKTSEDLIKSSNEDIDKRREIEKKYLILKERLKHAPIEERLAFAQDWYDLNQIGIDNQLNYEHHVEFANFYATAPPGERKAEREIEKRHSEENRIQVSEIIKRMDQRLTKLE